VRDRSGGDVNDDDVNCARQIAPCFPVRNSWCSTAWSLRSSCVRPPSLASTYRFWLPAFASSTLVVWTRLVLLGVIRIVSTSVSHPTACAEGGWVAAGAYPTRTPADPDFSALPVRVDSVLMSLAASRATPGLAYLYQWSGLP